MLPFRLFVDTNAPTLLSSQDLERLCGRLCDLAVNPPHFLPTANQQICISLLLSVRWGFNFTDYSNLLVPAPRQDARLARHLWRSKPHTLSLYIPCLFTSTCQAASLPQRSWSSPPAGRPPAQSKVQYHVKSYIYIYIQYITYIHTYIFIYIHTVYHIHTYIHYIHTYIIIHT